MKKVAILKSVEQIDDVATGAKLREMRNKADLSLRKIATALGRSVPYLSDLELGRRAWTEALAFTYAEAINALRAPDPKRDAVPTRRAMK